MPRRGRHLEPHHFSASKVGVPPDMRSIVTVSFSFEREMWGPLRLRGLATSATAIIFFGIAIEEWR